MPETSLETPTPKLRPGHLLPGELEIESVQVGGEGQNAYIAHGSGEKWLVLERMASQVEFTKPPPELEAWFPVIQQQFAQADRAYVVFPCPSGEPFGVDRLDCWEPRIVVFLCELIEACRQLNKYQLDLRGLGLNNLYLKGEQLLFYWFPSTARADRDLEEMLRSMIENVLLTRLVPAKTRNLERPLSCLAVSKTLTELLEAYLAGQSNCRDLYDELLEMKHQDAGYWDIHCLSTSGSVRDHNEDACGWMSAAMHNFQQMHQCHLVGVSDGMGGHQKGEVASMHTLSNWMCNMMKHTMPGKNSQVDNPTMLNWLLETFDATEDAILQDEALSIGEAGGMAPGATLVAGLMIGRLFFLGNCGDSRAYRWHQGKLERLTHDHSLVQRFIDRGELEEEARHQHPQNNIITSFIGIERKAFKRDASVHRLEPGDVLLLCSDGLTDMLREKQIASILDHAENARAACHELVAKACESGGEDNISVIVAMDQSIARQDKNKDTRTV